MFDFLKRGETGAGSVPATGAPEVKASAAGRVAAWGSAGRVTWSARDSATLTRTGFAANPIGFRTVRMIAEAVAALPLVLQDHDRRYDIHPVIDLVRRPNGAQGRADLIEALI